MRGKRAKDIRKSVLQYMQEKQMDMRKFKGVYRRTKKNYNLGII